MPNYALDAIRGYQAVDNIYRRKRMDELALEDREEMKKRQAKYDERQDLMWEREDKAHENKQALIDADVAEIEAMFGPEVSGNPQAKMKIAGLVSDPQRVGELLSVHAELSKYATAGKIPPQELMTKAFNLAGKEELQARGGDDGLTREVASIVPSPKEGEVMIGFNVTGKDGKTYQAPMTVGASADPKDNVVQSIPINTVIEWVNGAATSAKAIALARARAGDRSFLDAYRNAAARQRELAQELVTYEQKKRIDSKYAQPVAAGKYGMYHNGKFIQNPATAGLGGPGGGGKPTVKYRDDGSFVVYDPNNQTAKVVHTPESAAMEAQRLTALWKEEQAEGILNFEPSSEEQQNYYNKQYQRLISGQRGPMFTPGQVLKQNGIEYVVDENGDPQPRQQAKSSGKNSSKSSKGKSDPEKKNNQGKQAAPKKQKPSSRTDQLELQREGNQQKNTKIVSNDLKALPGQVAGSFVDLAKNGLGAYQKYIGQPFVDGVSSVMKSQDHVREQGLLDQRYRNGVISKEQYIAGTEALNNKYNQGEQ